MTGSYHAIRQVSKQPGFGEGDVLVMFGELFARGYGNGLVEEAERRKMKVIRATVGRRDDNDQLRNLTAEELASMPGPVINVALEAGFDLEPDDKGISPVQQLKSVKLSSWESFEMDKKSWQTSQQKGRERFRKAVQEYLKQLFPMIPAGKNILFAHLMAGGVPRTKIVMPLMNRSLKGMGDRFLSSEKLWQSSIGQYMTESFNEVTAETFNILVTETTALRERTQASGAKVAYVAYGYHGTEVFFGGKYQWQTYSPYLQGWAKMRLENYARHWSTKGVACAVYNCPEILTNSSSIFSGVEVSLYPLLGALKKEAPDHPLVKKVFDQCAKLLSEEHTIPQVLEFTQKYLQDPLIREHCVYEKWPQHNSKEQLEKMVGSSDELVSWHADPKSLMTAVLSEVVFQACGQVMLADAFKPEAPVSWINHDIVSKAYTTN